MGDVVKENLRSGLCAWAGPLYQTQGNPVAWPKRDQEIEGWRAGLDIPPERALGPHIGSIA